jgi:tRNA pseudouridine55 synthase
MNNISGIVILRKDEGMTSQTAVKRLQRLLGVTKAGHTGTLDPMATGVLPILVGRGVKASEFMLTSDKHYAATLTLGITTDTEDTTGEVLTTSTDIPEPERVAAAIEAFVGKYRQTPPMYSALKVGGKKLCDLAREGVTIEREAREIEIYSIDYRMITPVEWYLDVRCSKGTYIRTLCADIGASLGCGAAMSSLERVEASGFTLDDAHTLGEIEAMSEEERLALVIPTEAAFQNWQSVTLPDFFSRLCHSGLEIYLKKIGVSLDVGTRVKIYDKNGFFAVGEVREYDAGLAIKPIRQF